MRSDARRNRKRLLEASVEMILDVGAEPSLDAIARRAGVGIGTLYRHFPDRESLLNAVAHHVLERSLASAEDAMARAEDGYDALRRYMHEAVDHGLGVLNLIHPLLTDPDWSAQRARAETLLGNIVERAKTEGLLRHEVQPTDVVFGTIRFSRPVAIGLSRADERAIAHRHLDIYVDGLGSGSQASASLADLPPMQ